MSSAVPEDLLAYVAATAPHHEALAQAIRGIDEVLAAFVASSGGHTRAGMFVGLEAELTAVARTAVEVDERVGQVGEAFLLADSGAATAGVRDVPDATIDAALTQLDTDGPLPSWLRDFLLADVANFWAGPDGGFPYGRAAASGLHMFKTYGWLKEVPKAIADPKVNPAVVGRWTMWAHKKFPTFNNKISGKAVTSVAKLAGFKTFPAWMITPQATKLFQRVGVVGGAVSTGFEVKNLVDQGNMVDAFEREGAGYVADLARTGFSASSTAFMIAPTPITGGAMIVTGLVWAGAEAWDEWGDDITNFVDEGWDTARVIGDVAVDAVTAHAVDAWVDTSRTVERAWDDTSRTLNTGRRVADAAVSHTVSEVGGAVSGAAKAAGDAVDDVGDAVSGAADKLKGLF